MELFLENVSFRDVVTFCHQVPKHSGNQFLEKIELLGFPMLRSHSTLVYLISQNFLIFKYKAVSC